MTTMMIQNVKEKDTAQTSLRLADLLFRFLPL